MRPAVALCLVVALACTANPMPSHSTKPSPSPPKVASGGVVEFTVPSPIGQGSSCFDCGQASLMGIAAGADGNLWFVDAGQRKVGRITPSGTITEFGLPANVGGPYAITSGPDGNIWVTTNAVGHGAQDWVL